MKKKYWVIWTYSANYSGLIETEASSPEEAIERTTGFYSDNFRDRAAIFCFDTKPVLAINPEN